MSRKVVVLDLDVAEALSDIIHRAEQEEFDLTEIEDEMWGYLTAAIQNHTEIEP